MTAITSGSTGCNPVSNKDFLRAIFGGRWGGAHVCALPGDPNDPASRTTWAGGPARNNAANGDLEDAGYNQYWTVSLFRPDPGTGRAVRRISAFAGYYAVIFDDVGPKVAGADVLARIGPPSWRLETSPDNEQWGYILDTPETDLGRANGLAAALVAAGVSSTGRDPGMVGVTRYARMPVGRNGKPSAGDWTCVLREWAPGRTFTMEEIAAGWAVVLPSPGSMVARASVAVAPGVSDFWLDAMADMGRVSGQAGSGWGHLVTCPFVDEHTARADTGTAYRPGMRPGEAGSWKCNHGHCESREQNEFFARLECDIVAAGGKPARVAEFEDVSDEPGALLPPARLRPVPAAEAFLSEFVFMREDDAFLSLRSLGLQSRKSVNSTWADRLREDCTYTTTKTVGRGAAREEVEEDKVQAVDRWFFAQGDKAREADRQTYWPGEPVVFSDGVVDLVNRYRPVVLGGVDVRVANRDVRAWLDLVWHVCGGEGRRAYVRLLDWMAAVAGEPGFKPAWMVAVVGAQGIGKDMMMSPLQVAVGVSNYVRIEGDTLMSQFNDYEERRYIHVAELRQTSRGGMSGHDQYNKLKALVDPTQLFTRINPKGTKPYQARNVCAVYTSSNDENAIALEADDRRAFVFVSDAGKLPAWAYRDLGRWMAGGGSLVIARWLVQRWARMPAARRDALMAPAPATRGKARMTAASAGVVGEWIAQAVADGGSEWPDLMTSEDVMRQVQGAADAGTRGLPKGTRVPSRDAMGKLLPRLGAIAAARGLQVRLRDGRRRRVWAMRDAAKFVSLGGAAVAAIYDSGVNFNGSAVVEVNFTDTTG